MSQSSFALTLPPTEAEIADDEQDRRARNLDETAEPVALACVRALGLAVNGPHPSPSPIGSERYTVLFGPTRRHLSHQVEVSAADPYRVLDIGAGAGVWGQQTVRVLVEAGLPRNSIHLIALELDERERAHLERVADEVVIGDLMDPGVIGSLPEFDLIVGNPPFGTPRRWRGKHKCSCKTPGGRKENAKCKKGQPILVPIVAPDPELVWVEGEPKARRIGSAYLYSRGGIESSLIPRLLDRTGLLALFLTANALVRGEGPARVADEFVASVEVKVTGALGFRGAKRGKATDCYTLYVWESGPALARAVHDTVTRRIKWNELQPADRTWTKRPGT